MAIRYANRSHGTIFILEELCYLLILTIYFILLHSLLQHHPSFIHSSIARLQIWRVYLRYVDSFMSNNQLLASRVSQRAIYPSSALLNRITFVSVSLAHPRISIHPSLLVLWKRQSLLLSSPIRLKIGLCLCKPLYHTIRDIHTLL